MNPFTLLMCPSSLRQIQRKIALTACACLGLGFSTQPVSAVTTVPGTAVTSHFGNSFSMNALGGPKWANYAVEDIWVAPDGTTYNASEWDEAAEPIGIYKNGDKIGKLNSAHENVDGTAITGNATYVFVSQYNFFKRWNRSTNSVDGSSVDTVGQVQGLGADATRLFVGTDAAGGKIRVYNPSTLAFTVEWVFARPGRMSVDSAGDVWVLQRSDASNAPRAVKFSPTGTQLATITFATGFNPTDIATDGTTRVLVADGGPDQNIKIYNTASLTGTPTIVSDSLGTVGGVFAVGGGFVAGQAGANRFDGPTGVGIDSSGNYYVSTFSGGSVIESYNSTKARLWRIFGLEFEDCGDVDATNPNAIYTKDGKYTVNWANGVGQEATYWGTTLDQFKYPNDPRLWINANGNNNAGARIVTSGGHKLIYVWDQQSAYMQVYRFDGEIAVPAALFGKSGNSLEPRVGNPASNDPWDMWIWQDTDKDGQFDSNEFTTYRADNPYMFGWNVDRDGNVWKGMRVSGIRKLTLTVNANGIPTYAPAATVANPVPFDSAASGDIRRVYYDAATDILYISGFNSTNPQGISGSANDDRGAGRLMSRYPNWSTGNRVASHTIQLPYNFDTTDIYGDHYTPEAFDVVGGYVFVAYFDPRAARIGAYSSSSLTFVGEITADRVTGQIYGTDVDTPNAVTAYQRANGEYIILQSNYGYASGLMFRWDSTTIAPIITANQTANAYLTTPFSYQIAATQTPTSYALASGSLPPGITLNTATGLLSGTPTSTGTYTPGFTATNGIGTSAPVVVTLSISLTGTVLGTTGSWNGSSSTVDKVFDGNLTTFFDAPTANGNWAGLDFGLGDEKIITAVRYAPRSEQISRILNAIIQGSSSADFSTGVVNLYTITTSPTAGVLTAQSISNATGFRYVRILTANDSFGNVAELQFYGLPGVPAAPSGLAATASFAGQINLTWTDNAGNETGFKLERSPDGSTGWTQIATPAANVGSYADTALSAGTTYFYRIRVTNSAGDSSYSNITSTITFTGLHSFRIANGLAANGSQDLLTPANDGVANLLKYAFNMMGNGAGQGANLSTGNTSLLTVNGNAGLPLVGTDGSGKLTLTYIRRKTATNPGISYSVEFNSNLTNPWATNLSATETPVSIDSTFERATVTDSQSSSSRFARVKITAP